MTDRPGNSSGSSSEGLMLEPDGSLLSFTSPASPDPTDGKRDPVETVLDEVDGVGALSMPLNAASPATKLGKHTYLFVLFLPGTITL